MMRVGVRGALRWILAPMLAVSALGLGIAWQAGVLGDRIEPGRTARPEDPARGRPSARVDRAEIPTVVDVVGTLRADRRTAVSPEVASTIEQITVTAGDRVDAGQVLVRLDPTELDARVEQARQSLEADRARLRELEHDYERFLNLYRRGSATEKEFETTGRQLDQARSAVIGASEALREAEAMRAETTIRADLEGLVIDLLAEEGELAQPGRPLLQLYDPNTLRLEADVPESLVDRLARGQPVDVRLEAPGRTVSGVVDEIVPQSDPASRSTRVKVALPGLGGLTEGRFGRLLVPTGTRQALCIPREAVRTIGQLDFVEAVVGEDLVERRFVQLGPPFEDDRVEVLSGLREGDRVLLPGGRIDEGRSDRGDHGR